MAKKETTGYNEAITEIEEILERFSSEKFDIDKLAAEVKRATELIKECKQKLRKAEDEVTAILKEE